MNLDHLHPMSVTSSAQGYLEGRILLASPAMRDARFHESVILLCRHNAEGAKGIILNKPLPNLRLGELIQQFDLETDGIIGAEAIYFGGPVETSRGFVLHSDEYTSPETRNILPGVHLTATLDIVRSITDNTGPGKRLIALGYAGWDGGQLEDELRDNAWLVAKGNAELLFDAPVDMRWHLGYESVGIEPARFTDVSGSA